MVDSLPDPVDEGLANPQVLLEYIKAMNGIVESQSKLIFDATKYNFTAFGAIFLLTNAPFYKDIVSTKSFVVFGCIVVMTISVACAAFIVNRGIYANVARKKRSVAERTLYRERNFSYFRKKLNEEWTDIKMPYDMDMLDYVSSSYPMKTINLLPALFSLFIIVYMLVGFELPMRH